MHHNILSERSQTQSNIHCTISFMETSRKCKLIIADKNKWLLGDRVWIGRQDFFIIYFLNLWLHWVFVAPQGLQLQCPGFSLQWLLLLWSKGSRPVGFTSCSGVSVVVVYRLCCSMACEIFLDHGSNPCPLYWKVDSYPWCHQGSLAGKLWGMIHKDPEENLSGGRVMDVFTILIVVMLHRFIQWTLEQCWVWTCRSPFVLSTVNSIVLHWCMIG